MLNKLLLYHHLLFAFASGLCCKVSTGMDQLISSNAELIKNKRTALFANSASVTANGIPSYRLISANSELKMILTAEHGYFITAKAGERVHDGKLGNIPLVSLYNERREVPVGLREQIDVIVADIQDIGVRSYTYISSLKKIMEYCAEVNLPLIVADRPNPFGGYLIDGCYPDPSMLSFVCAVNTPYLHGLTIGEIAIMIKKELEDKGRKIDLTVIRMDGWERGMCWEDTGLDWLPTSPNIPSMESVRGCASIGLAGELDYISVGIGTTFPFRFIGSSDTLRTIDTYASPCGLYEMVISDKKGHPVKGHFISYPEKESRYFTEGLLTFLPLITETAFSKTALFSMVVANEKMLRAIEEKNKALILSIIARDIELFRTAREPFLLY